MGGGCTIRVSWPAPTWAGGLPRNPQQEVDHFTSFKCQDTHVDQSGMAGLDQFGCLPSPLLYLAVSCCILLDHGRCKSIYESFRRIRHIKIRTASFPIDLFAEVSPARPSEFVCNCRRKFRRIAAAAGNVEGTNGIEGCL